MFIPHPLGLFDNIVCALLGRLNDCNTLKRLNSLDIPYNFNHLLLAEIGRNGNINMLKWTVTVERSITRENMRLEVHYLCAKAAFHANMNILNLVQSIVRSEDLPSVVYQSMCSIWWTHQRIRMAVSSQLAF